MVNITSEAPWSENLPDFIRAVEQKKPENASCFNFLFLIQYSQKYLLGGVYETY